MDLDRDGQAVICVTDRAIVRGRIAHGGESLDANSTSTGEGTHRASGGFVTLIDATILDHDHRIVKRVARLALNRRYIIYFMDDEMAPYLDRIKAMVSAEDYDGAQGELERLLNVGGGDAELLYLAGVVSQRLGNEERAKECLARALGLTVDEKLRTIIKRHLERD